MTNDRLATLLSATPADPVRDPQPRPDALLRRFRRRGPRGVAAARVGTWLAGAGMAVPLPLWGGIGGQGRTPGPAPLGSGTTAPQSPPPGAGPSPTTIPDAGVIRCTTDGVEV